MKQLTKKQQEKNMKHQYMMLGRLKMDIDYFFGNGQIYGPRLYYGEINQHFKEMVNLWKSLPFKPLWLRATKIIDYKKKIQNYNNNLTQ